ncbi:MAG TPA: HupE/UreJ family protein [Myxococcota bacterium]|nr:HupE/UreJ family protein [Myxococcota bacterium]
MSLGSRCGRRLGSGVWSGALLVALFVASTALAHPLAPALLELVEDRSGRVEVLWKRSSLSVPGSRIEPVLPSACPAVGRPSLQEQGVARVLRWTIDCGERGLVGQPVRVEGLGPAKIDTLVRIELADGRSIQRVLRRGEPEIVVPARASRLAVFTDYLRIGFEHILGGADHLLFVFGLFLLCTGLKPLVQTVTSFTVGHSLTLSLAALGYASLPAGPIEVLIAVSVLALAVELSREPSDTTLMRRHPWPMALLFGLLHGMGFAGALREVGLPSGEIPMALFSFNVGIELGQLGFVLVLLALVPIGSRLLGASAASALPRRIAVYGMGSLAAFWVFERAATIL